MEDSVIFVFVGLLVVKDYVYCFIRAVGVARLCHCDVRMTQLIVFLLTEKEVLIKGLQLTGGALSCGPSMYSGYSFFLRCLR